MPLVVSEEWVRDYCKRTGQKVPAELEKTLPAAANTAMKR